MKKNQKIILASFGICVSLLILTILVMNDAPIHQLFDGEKGLLENVKESMIEPEYWKMNESEVNDKMSFNEKENETWEESKKLSVSETKEHEDMFYISELNEQIKERITGISYPANDSDLVISYEDLSYVQVLYYNFDNEVSCGELICNKAIAQDLLEIFQELFEAHYQIESIRLVDEFDGDDEASMAANNSSCFNYRVIAGTKKISNHAYGLAIDINPFYNPYITTKNGEQIIQPVGSEIYCDRNFEFDHKIDEDDLAYQLFIAHGFTWGGAWKNSKDYQHFEKTPVE